MPTRPPSFLLGLPNELHAMIFEDETLSDNDLTSLRATCQHISSFATKVLGGRRFINLAVSYTENGLKRFADLAASELGPYVRSVHFTINARSMASHACRRTTAPNYSGLREITVSHLDGHIVPLEEVFRGAIHLEVLKLQCLLISGHGSLVHARWCGEKINHTVSSSIDRTLECLNSDRLAGIHLSATVVSADVLLHLLMKHRRTVFSIRLLRGCILVEGGWLTILVWIQLALASLQVLHLGALSLAVKKRPERGPGRDIDTAMSEQSTHRVASSVIYLTGRRVGSENIRTALSSALETKSSGYQGQVARVKTLMSAEQKKEKARDAQSMSSRVLRTRRGR